MNINKKIPHYNQIYKIAYINIGDYMNFDDKFFKKVENKTKVDKDTIISLATKLQKGNLKDENSLREVISTLSQLTGKKVSKEKEDKIIDTILKDKVPKGVSKMF